MKAFRRRLLLLALGLGVFMVAGAALAAPGDLDPTFGNGGILIEDLGALDGNGVGGVVDSQGRILALGLIDDGDDDFVVYRHLPDGKLDPSWGQGGNVQIEVDGNDSPSDLALTSDGGVVVVGSSGPYGARNMSLVKLTDVGALDTGFSSDGKLLVDFGASDSGIAVEVMPDGRIVAAGPVDVGGAWDIGVAVIHPNGQLDGSFAGNGRTTIDLGGGDSANAVTATSDGSIVVGGHSDGDMALVVFLPSGVPDPGFSGDGVTMYDAGGLDDRADAVEIDSSERIVLAGKGFDGTYDFMALRYNRNGTLDAGFGDQGVARHPIGSSFSVLRAMAIAPTEHLVLAGYSGNSPNRNLALMRLTADGGLDTTFGQGGFTTTDIGADDFGRGVAVGEEGSVFVVGDSTAAGNRDLVVVKYEGTPPPVDPDPDPDLECVESFKDDNGHVFEDDINCIASADITRGCNPPVNDEFCPDSTVTRGQMAAFLTRALDLAASSETFSDTVGHTFEADVAALAAADITRGCNPPVNDQFCPDQRLTRGQMAAFLTRALDLAASSETFSDTVGHVFEEDVAALAGAGITKGCNPPDNTLFCPDQPVTRGQMAAFLNRALLSD